MESFGWHKRQVPVLSDWKAWLSRFALGAAVLPGLAVVTACNVAAVVTVERIIEFASNAITVFQGLQQLAGAGSRELQTGLEELRPDVVTGRVEDVHLKAMERRLARMREISGQLQSRVKAADKAVSEYLELLEKRAKQNRTSELRERMLADIDAQRSALDARLLAAKAAFKRLDTAIQKYDDILGYFQVQRGLEEVRERVTVIDQTIAEAIQLNHQVDTAVREGISIIEKLSPGADRVVRSALPASAATADTQSVSECSGGAACPTTRASDWWCTSASCACASGLARLDGQGTDVIGRGLAFNLRFSSVRHADKDPVCDGSPSETVCIRTTGGAALCSSRGDACGRRTNSMGPTSIDSLRVTTEDFTRLALDISVWSQPIDTTSLSEALQRAANGAPPDSLVAWQRSAHHQNGVKRGALCIGIRFDVPPASTPVGEGRIVTLFATP